MCEMFLYKYQNPTWDRMPHLSFSGFNGCILTLYILGIVQNMKLL